MNMWHEYFENVVIIYLEFFKAMLLFWFERLGLKKKCWIFTITIF